MNSQPHSFLQLSSNPLFTNLPSLSTRFTCEVAHNLKLPYPLQLFLLFIQSFQLFAQIFLQSTALNSTVDLSSEVFLNPITLFAKILSPGWLLDFTNSSKLSYTIIIFTVLLCIFQVILLIYSLAFASNKAPKNQLLLKLCSWEFHTHIPFTFFVVISVCSRVILLASQDDEFPFHKMGSIIGFSFLIFLQFAGAMIHLLMLNDLLPRSDLFASSTEAVDLTIVLHQSILILLQFLPTQNIKANFWIITLISLGFSIVSLSLHFSRLPNHNIKALYYRGYLLGLIGLFNLVLVIRVTAITCSPTEYPFGVDSALIIFACLGIIFIKLIRVYLNQTLMDIISISNETKSEQKQLYKISIMKYLFRTKIPLDEGSKPTDLHNLLFTATSLKPHLIFNNVTNDLNSPNSNKKIFLRQIFVRHLEGLLVLFPKSDLIKLYIAYYHAKKLQNFEPAIKMLSKLEQTRTRNIKTSACLLKRDIEKMMREPVQPTQKTQTKSRKINLRPYLDSKLAFSKLQGDILKQTNLQIKIYQEFIKDDVDISKIFSSSQQVIDHQRALLKLISSTLSVIPDTFIAPYFLLQGYFSQVNHSYPDYRKCTQALSHKYQRFQKSWTSAYLTQENLYNQENIFLVISGQKESLGQIHYCSNSAFHTLGWDAKSLIGRNFLTLIPSCFQQIYLETMNNFTQENITKIQEPILRIFLVNRTGFILQVDLCVAIHPFMERGFFINIVIRPVPENKDYLIVNSEGKIEGFTENVGSKLGLTSKAEKNIEVEEISNKLGEVNKALNLIEQFRNRPEIIAPVEDKGETLETFSEIIKRESSPSLTDKTVKGLTRRMRTIKLTIGAGQIDFPKATEILGNFLTQGEEIVLNSLKGNTRDILCNCRIEERAYQSNNIIRLYVLQERISRMYLDSSDSSNLVEKAKNYYHGMTIKSPFLKQEQVEDPSSQESTSQEDQQEGNIAFKKEYFETPQTTYRGVHSPSKRLSNDNTTEPLSSQRLLVVSSPVSAKDLKASLSSSNKVIKLQGMAKKNEEMIRRELAAVVEVNHSIGSQSSQTLGYERVTKAYQKAMLVKYYPKYIARCFLLILGIYIALFSMQTNSGVRMDSDFTNAQAKKDVVQAAEMRNFLLIEIDDLVRYEVQTLTTFLNTGAGIPDMSILPYLMMEAKKLGEINHELLSATSSLKDEDRTTLFERDVKVYDTYFHDPNPVWTDLTNFEAVDAISVAINRGFHYAIIENNPEMTVDTLKFVLRNSVNELLLRSEETVDIFLKSLRMFEKNSQNFLRSRFVTNFWLLILSLVIVNIIIWMQYKKEKENILAFARLSPEEAAKILEKLIEFKKSVEDESYYAKEKQRYEEKPNGVLSVSAMRENIKRKPKKNGHREAKYQGTIRNSVIHTIRIVIFVAILLGIFSAEFNVMKGKIQLVYTKLAQLHYSNWMLGRISMLYVSLIELLAEENMIIVRNQPAYDQVLESLDQVSDIMLRITTGYFAESDSNYDPEVYSLLFEDVCTQMTDPYNQWFCFFLQKAPKTLTFVNLLSMMQFNAQQSLQAYRASNKTIGELVMINAQANFDLLSPLLILQTTTKALSARLDEVFEESIEEAKAQNMNIGVSLNCLLVVAVVLIWFSIVRKVRESDNKFKNMLSIFPHSFILSNFMLKAYLKKTSKEALNLVKHQI